MSDLGWRAEAPGFNPSLDPGGGERNHFPWVRFSSPQLSEESRAYEAALGLEPEAPETTVTLSLPEPTSRTEALEAAVAAAEPVVRAHGHVGVVPKEAYQLQTRDGLASWWVRLDVAP